ncbi:hypothetical protein N0V82_009183 [Gnomoniopsis sp. IMI 355080]|nr:hypothetical protein N0V82_009183 [Gnomoniopsis sp. IMI 355080]
MNLLLLLALSRLTSAALDVDLDSPDSIKTAAKAVASNLLTYYSGDEPGKTPGILPGPPPNGDYYWWEGGALWGTLVEYWHQTGDTEWNNMTEASLTFQSDNSFQPENWTISLGNDDQGFWGMSALLAAETNFQNPPAKDSQWLALAQGVFNTQASPDRHDDACGGGLRWQIPSTNVGYNYKNSIANGIFFNLGARLARYTSNDTYSDWAVKTWDWMEGIGLIDEHYNVFDGGHVEDNCTTITKTQFSYCAAVILEGAAFMYNYTDGSDLWSGRVQGLVNRTISYFFPNGVAVEPACELNDKIQCDTDQLSFKGYVHRWLATAAQVAPVVYQPIMTTLKNSTAAAVKSCANDVANPNGYSTATCGFRWTTGAYDGLTGAGQQMNALGALTSLLVAVDPQSVAAPVTNTSGGTSVGDSNAGGDTNFVKPLSPVQTKDRVGAGILTALVLVLMSSALFWMCTEVVEGWFSQDSISEKGALMSGAI